MARFKIMPAEELWEGDILGVEAGGVKILLVSLDDQIKAYYDRCPHRATRLSDGELDGSKLTCPTHLWEFNILSGRGINPATSRLISFPVEVEDGQIYVEVPNAASLPGADYDEDD